MTQPIQMRFNELLSGARSEVAVAIYGDDLDLMGTTAKQIAAVLAKIRGAADLRIAQAYSTATDSQLLPPYSFEPAFRRSRTLASHLGGSACKIDQRRS
jgi:hypothetical protein